MPRDYTGNTPDTAGGLNITPTSQTFRDSVGSLDTNDYYRFTLSGRSSFNLSVKRMTADVNVQLLNSSGEVVQTSARRGTKAESIRRFLEAGTYYIVVYPGSRSASTYYNLKVSANQAPQSLQFNTTKSVYNVGETVSLSNASVYDGNGYSDLKKVDFKLQKDGGAVQDISDAVNFTVASNDGRGASFNYNLSNLSAGNYILSGKAYDKSGAVSNEVQRIFTVQ